MSEIPDRREIPEEFINQVVHTLTTQYDPKIDEFKNVDSGLHELLVQLSQNPFIAELDVLKLAKLTSTDELFIYEALEDAAHEQVRDIEKASDIFFEFMKRRIHRMIGSKRPRQIERSIDKLFFKYINILATAFVLPGSKDAARNRVFHLFAARLIGRLIQEFWDHEHIVKKLQGINFKNNKPSGAYGDFAWKGLKRCELFPLPEFEGETDPIHKIDLQELHTLTTWRRLDSPIQVEEDGLKMRLESGPLSINHKLIEIRIKKEVKGQMAYCHLLYLDRVSGELRMSGSIIKANLPDSTRFRIKRIAIKHMMARLNEIEDNLVFEESKWKIKPAEPKTEIHEAVTSEVRAEIAKTELIEVETEPEEPKIDEIKELKEVKVAKKTYVKLEGKRRASRVIRTLKRLLGEPLRQGRHTVFASRNGGIVACPTHGSGQSQDINVNTLKATLAVAGISHKEYASTY